MPLADIGAEFLFQVISERAERKAIIVTMNLPFGMDDNVSEPEIVQGAIGPGDRPGAYYRDRDGVLPIPADDGKEEATVRGGGEWSRSFCHPGGRSA